ncbi:MAG: hypothetical protein ACI30J_08960 [Paludibacteraceae bacterium]
MTLEEQTALLELEQAVKRVRRAVDEVTFDQSESTGTTPWVSVTDKEKPNDGEVVIVYISNGIFYCQTYTNAYGFGKPVTHWMRVLPPTK